MAAPHVAGLVSAALALHSSLDISEIRGALRNGQAVTTAADQKVGAFPKAADVLTALTTGASVAPHVASSDTGSGVLDPTLEPLPPHTDDQAANEEEPVQVVNLNPDQSVHSDADKAWTPIAAQQESGDHPSTIMVSAVEGS